MRVLFLLLCNVFCGILLQAQDAREIVRKADARARGTTSEARITIQIIRPNWKREMGLKAWSQGNDYSLALVTSPAKDKGIVYLKRKKEVWNWIPSIERNVKLPPSMMSQSWMGTDFTNDDLVKEASIVEDYVQSLMPDATVDGYNCYQVALVPKPEAAVVWGRVLLWIEKKDLLMLHAEYYDESGKLVNILHASEVKMLGGRLLPSRLEMIPADKKGQKTVMIYESLQFDKPLPEQIFTTSYMSRVQ
ncbi:MAG: outer membrane lipoprotein-sorting protein [Chitinophagaceae bacterium]|jgi:outer membrane lipoprotein-sorting protein|nr:outer membrane lipoprotein-sorting protein [Chitinophagaceae bacterium]